MSAPEGRPEIRLGIVGLGLAARMVLDSLVDDPRIAVVAGADPAEPSRAEFARRTGAAAYPDVAELLDAPGVDAVWVASPTRFHRAHVEAAAAAGKDVIVEKPMAPTVDDCAAMVTAADKAGVLLVAGGVRSLDPAFAAMRDVIGSGALGTLRHLSATAHTGWLLRDRAPADLDESLGGGIVFNQAPHQVDTVRLLAGGAAVRSVLATTATWSERRPVVGQFRAELDFDGGLTAVLCYDGHGYLRSTDLVRVEGPASSVLADAGLVVASGSRGAVRPHGDHLQLVTDDGAQDIPISPGDATTGAVAELLAARRPGAGPPRHCGEWGRATLEVVAAIGESARTRTRVLLAEKGLHT
ncbi:Gfo/Idh/MocA family protein [Pseudonocardia sp. GCM10023141]|uniref:Gfo/Idh/MocA family protein n=1 Tax=Pseudonocardia sp. GCM10023141 TaxID=3252653 RepID=UPI00360E6316